MYSVKSVGLVSSRRHPGQVQILFWLGGRSILALSWGKYEFACSTWSVNLSWNSRCWPLVLASLLSIKLPALMSTRLLRILYIMYSRLCLRRCSRDSQLRSENIFVTHPGVFVEYLFKAKRAALRLTCSIALMWFYL